MLGSYVIYTVQLAPSGNSGKSAGYTGEHVHAEILKKDPITNEWKILIPTKEDLIELEKLGVAHAK
ncbi:hypothetical protein [Leptospira biflexa]|uniref:hypothetical protein n=1 Tax=Leptospira biflexa TaxID=172 RepID=UPI001082B07E|nr:hypothetical protein [Leptospira biflexa]TGM34026.1 hypothetical protein EHQ89_12490 [Leptospira biflexa]TGM40315.1 hypothetical protein EHQ80_03845 [Leptospira biflexa]